MKILLVEKKKNHISALNIALTQIKDCKCKRISSIVIVDEIKKLDKKIIEEKPDILILDGDFIFYQAKENISSLKALYPEISILVLTSNYEQEKKFVLAGIEDFIPKDSADKFYDEMVAFLNMESNKKEINKNNNFKR
jgi:DNA-binding NarL/FixJ family response regulator